MIIPDKPISSLDEDKLGLRTFAESLGNKIRDWNQKESVVIALFGPWGCGKTSLLNMISEQIILTTNNWDKGKKPIIINFNPWNFSEQSKLLQAFFKHLFINLEKIIPNKKKKALDLLKKFGETLGSAEGIPEVGGLLGFINKIINWFVPEKSLEEIKNEISSLFDELNRRIIIVIDDIDRLTENEIRNLFQLIKINADFPNIMYLLAFDRAVVESALNKEQSISGREYLEKIVQDGYDVPKIDSSYIYNYLFKLMDDVFSASPLERWDDARWANLFHSGIKTFFKNLRDVKRYINSFSFSYSSMKDEINPVDLIGIEVLRVFTPGVYHSISSNKDLFTQTTTTNTNKEEEKKYLEEIFLKEKNPGTIKNICLQLFPNINIFFKNTSYASGFFKDWREERRVCSSKIFDTYFMYGTPPGIVSRSEMLQIISNSGDPQYIDGVFIKLIENNKIINFLDQIRDYENEFSREQIKGFCESLLFLGNEMENIQIGFMSLGTDLKIVFNIIRLMKKLNMDNVYNWFEVQLSKPISLYSIMYIISQSEVEDESSSDYQLFDEKNNEKLKILVIEKIISYSESGELLQQKHLDYIMMRWQQWSENEKAIEDFVKIVITDLKKLLQFLMGFISEERTLSTELGSQVKVDKNINFEALNLFYDQKSMRDVLVSFSDKEVQELSEDERTFLYFVFEQFKKLIIKNT